jgi:hypothetical protein
MMSAALALVLLGGFAGTLIAVGSLFACQELEVEW